MSFKCEFVTAVVRMTPDDMAISRAKCVFKTQAPGDDSEGKVGNEVMAIKFS